MAYSQVFMRVYNKILLILGISGKDFLISFSRRCVVFSQVLVK